jgi:hypothetical protein
LLGSSVYTIIYLFNYFETLNFSFLYSTKFSRKFRITEKNREGEHFDPFFYTKTSALVHCNNVSQNKGKQQSQPKTDRKNVKQEQNTMRKNLLLKNINIAFLEVNIASCSESQQL